MSLHSQMPLGKQSTGCFAGKEAEGPAKPGLDLGLDGPSLLAHPEVARSQESLGQEGLASVGASPEAGSHLHALHPLPAPVNA